MILIFLLALSYGGPHWFFPWWVWSLAALSVLPQIKLQFRKLEGE